MIKISLEGIDGSGKSTQAKMLNDYLVSKGKEVLFLHEPRILREEIFQAVKEIKEGKVTDAYLSYLFGKDGVQCRLAELFSPGNIETKELGENIKVKEFQIDFDYLIRDRDTTISQYAYHHGFGTPDEMNYLMAWYCNEINSVDKIVFINVSPKDAVKRIGSRAENGKEQQEYFEKEEKLAKVYANYLELFGDRKKLKLMGLDTAEIIMIDGMDSKEGVHKKVIESLKL
jgi:dTMP kinase